MSVSAAMARRTGVGVVATLVLAVAAFLPTGLASAAKASGSASAQIAANWVAFFSPKTPVARRIALLQNGSEFAGVIKAQASSPLSQGVSVKVLSVKVKGHSATVRYTIYEAGQPALKNQTGTALLQGKVWKVGDTSFCALLSLEGTKVAACPKA